MTQPWYRVFSTGRSASRWLVRVNAVLATGAGRDPVTVRASSTLMDLPQLERAVALAAVALAERTLIVMLDQRDSFTSAEDEAAFVVAVCQLAPENTTVIMGTPLPVRARWAGDTGPRVLVEIDLYQYANQGVLR